MDASQIVCSWPRVGRTEPRIWPTWWGCLFAAMLFGVMVTSEIVLLFATGGDLWTTEAAATMPAGGE